MNFQRNVQGPHQQSTTGQGQGSPFPSSTFDFSLGGYDNFFGGSGAATSTGGNGGNGAGKPGAYTALALFVPIALAVGVGAWTLGGMWRFQARGRGLGWRVGWRVRAWGRALGRSVRGCWGVRFGRRGWGGVRGEGNGGDGEEGGEGGEKESMEGRNEARPSHECAAPSSVV